MKILEIIGKVEGTKTLFLYTIQCTANFYSKKYREKAMIPKYMNTTALICDLHTQLVRNEGDIRRVIFQSGVPVR